MFCNVVRCYPNWTPKHKICRCCRRNTKKTPPIWIVNRCMSKRPPPVLFSSCLSSTFGFFEIRLQFKSACVRAQACLLERIAQPSPCSILFVASLRVPRLRCTYPFGVFPISLYLSVSPTFVYKQWKNKKFVPILYVMLVTHTHTKRKLINEMKGAVAIRMVVGDRGKKIVRNQGSTRILHILKY